MFLKLTTCFQFTIFKLFSMYFICRASKHKREETLKVIYDSKRRFHQEKANFVFKKNLFQLSS